MLDTNVRLVRTAAIGRLATHVLNANVRFVEIDLNIRTYNEYPLPAYSYQKSVYRVRRELTLNKVGATRRERKVLI